MAAVWVDTQYDADGNYLSGGYWDYSADQAADQAAADAAALQAAQDAAYTQEAQNQRIAEAQAATGTTSSTATDWIKAIGVSAFDALKAKYTTPATATAPAGINWGNVIKDGTTAAAALYAFDAAKNPAPPVGYQGGIPTLSAIRTALPQADGVRPGAGGQRYFTDMEYANTAGLPAAVANTKAQAAALALQNQAKAPPVTAVPPVNKPTPNQFFGRAAGGLIALAAGGPTPAPAGQDVNLPQGAFVVPADVVGHFGNGNSDAGAANLQRMLGNTQYFKGSTDGMADKVPAAIDGQQRAAVAHGEVLVHPDAVARAGGGNQDKGTKNLYTMMDKIRAARTGSKEQGKQIDPHKFAPGGITKLAEGGDVKHFAGTTGSTVPAGTTGTESNLSNWAGPYVTNMLGQGAAVAATPYQAYQGPLTAGPSDLQTQAFGNAAQLQVPGSIGQAANTAGQVAAAAPGAANYQSPVNFGNTFQAPAQTGYGAAQAAGPAQVGTQSFNTPGTAASFMSPYQQNVIAQQQQDAQRQADIATTGRHSDQVKQGAYGGSRGAIMDAEAARNLALQKEGINTTGLQSAFTAAQNQFNTQQGQSLQAQTANQNAGLQTNLANTSAQNAASQFGAQQGLTAAQLNAQYGLAGQQATEASSQFGANLGLQGLNTQLSAANAQGNLGVAQNSAGIAALNTQLGAGATQQGITQAGIAADQNAFNAEQQNPFKMVQFQQSLLQGLPLAAQSYNTTTNPYNAAAAAAGAAQTMPV